jgi:hypothetical protein
MLLPSLTHRIPGGGHVVNLAESSGIVVPPPIFDLDYRAAPAAHDPSSALASDEWLLQELSGSYANNKGGSALSVFTGGRQGASAFGLSNGTDMVSQKAWEALSTSDRVECADSTTLDSDDEDISVRVRFRCAPGSSARYVCGKRQSAGNYGWAVYVNGASIYVAATGPGGIFTTSAMNVNARGRSWLELALFYDLSANTLYAKCNGLTRSVSTVGMGSMTNSEPLSIGKYAAGNSPVGLQVNYLGGVVGVDAAAFYAQVYSMPGDVTAEMTTFAKSTPITVPVGPGAWATYNEDRLPRAWAIGAVSGAGGFGIWPSSPKTNILDYSNSFSGVWAKSATLSLTGADAEAPDGFFDGTTAVSSAANDEMNRQVSCSAARYTASIPIKAIASAGATVDGLIRIYDVTNASYVASEAFSVTVGETLICSATGVTLAGCTSLRMYIRFDDAGSTAEIGHAQVNLGYHRGEYVPTDGAAASTTASNYRSSTSRIPEGAGEIECTFTPMDLLAAACPFAADSTADERALYSTVSVGFASAVVRNDASGIEASITGAVALDAGTERVSRLLWDEVSGVDGYRAVLVSNGERANSAVMPWSAPSGGADNGSYIGMNRSTVNQLNGLLSRVRVWASPRAI